jgi:hypothetical protein
VDPEAITLLHEISGGPSPPDRRWKNHNLRRLRYRVNRDLKNIMWWYWLGGDYDDIPLLPIQNPYVSIWAAGCRRYGPETSEIIYYCSTKCCIRHEFDLWMHNFSVIMESPLAR